MLCLPLLVTLIATAGHRELGQALRKHSSQLWKQKRPHGGRRGSPAGWLRSDDSKTSSFGSSSGPGLVEVIKEKKEAVRSTIPSPLQVMQQCCRQVMGVKLTLDPGGEQQMCRVSNKSKTCSNYTATQVVRHQGEWANCSSLACCSNCTETLSLTYTRPLAPPNHPDKQKSGGRKGKALQATQRSKEVHQCTVEKMGVDSVVLRRLQCAEGWDVAFVDPFSGEMDPRGWDGGTCEMSYRVRHVRLSGPTILKVIVTVPGAVGTACSGNVTFDREDIIHDPGCRHPPCYTNLKYWSQVSRQTGVPKWVFIALLVISGLLLLAGMGQLAFFVNMMGKISRLSYLTMMTLPESPAGRWVSQTGSNLKSWFTPDDGRASLAMGSVAVGNVAKTQTGIGVNTVSYMGTRLCTMCGVVTADFVHHCHAITSDFGAHGPASTAGMFLSSQRVPLFSILLVVMSVNKKIRRPVAIMSLIAVAMADLPAVCVNARLGTQSPITSCPVDGTECHGSYRSSVELTVGQKTCITTSMDQGGKRYVGDIVLEVEPYKGAYEVSTEFLYQSHSYVCHTAGNFRCQDSGRCSSDCAATLLEDDGSMSLTAHGNVDPSNFVTKVPGHASCVKESEDSFFECFKSIGCQYCRLGMYVEKGPIDVFRMKSFTPYLCTKTTIWQQKAGTWVANSVHHDCGNLDGNAGEGRKFRNGKFMNMSGKLKSYVPLLTDKVDLAVAWEQGDAGSVLHPSTSWLTRAADVNVDSPAGVIGSIQSKGGQGWFPHSVRVSKQLYQRISSGHQCTYTCGSSGVNELDQDTTNRLPIVYNQGTLSAGVINTDYDPIHKHLVAISTDDCGTRCQQTFPGTTCSIANLGKEHFDDPKNTVSGCSHFQTEGGWIHGELKIGDPCKVAAMTSCWTGTAEHSSTKICACGQGRTANHVLELKTPGVDNVRMFVPGKESVAELQVMFTPSGGTYAAEVIIDSEGPIAFVTQISTPYVDKFPDHLDGCYSCDEVVVVQFVGHASPLATTAEVTTNCEGLTILDTSIGLDKDPSDVTIRVQPSRRDVKCQISLSCGGKTASFPISGTFVFKDNVILGNATVVTSPESPDDPDLNDGVDWDLFDPSSWSSLYGKIMGWLVYVLLFFMMCGMMYCFVVVCVPGANMLKDSVQIHRKSL